MRIRIVCLGRVKCGILRPGRKTRLSVMDCDECGAQLWSLPVAQKSTYLSSDKLYTMQQV
jgi:hypothetical protein